VTVTLAVVELATRIPIQLSPGQSRVVVVVGAGLALALLVGVVLEGVFGGAASLVLRLLGHPPPRKSSFRMALDEMEARLQKRDE
jgi:hypothetical protein